MNRREFAMASVVATGLSRADAAVPKRRVAVIGHTTRGDYGHAIDTLWLRRPETEIVAVADANAAGLAKARERLKLDHGYAKYAEMLKVVKPEIVAIAPRFVDEHREMILAAVEHGARGIYCEKPFCRTPAEADEILAAIAKHRVKLAVAHRNRYHPALPVAKKLIDGGAIGTLLELRGRGKEDARGGAVDAWILGTHLFNLAAYLAGPPRACSGMLYAKGKSATGADIVDGLDGIGPVAGDEAHARFEMTRGVPFHFDSIRNAGVANAGFGLQAIGTKGIIDFRIDTEPLAHLLEGNPFKPSQEARAWVPISSAGPGQPEPMDKLGVDVGSHSLAVLDLLSAMDTGDEPLCGARDAALTVEMVHSLFASHRLGGQRVELPLQSRQHGLKNP